VLEKQLAHDLFFRRFRQTLERLSLMDKLLSKVNDQLSNRGLYIKPGGISIVDASVIEAKHCFPNKDKSGKSTQAPKVKWNVKAGFGGQRKSTYGFEARIDVDEDGLIKSTEYDPGNVYDSNYFIPLLYGTSVLPMLHVRMPAKKHTKCLRPPKVIYLKLQIPIDPNNTHEIKRHNT
jgi:hypothetical protein